AEDGIRDFHVTGVQTCALPISGIVAERTLAGLSRVHVLEAAGPRGTSAPLRELLPLGTDRVVPLSLLGVAEDFVSLVDLFEALRSEEHTSELQSRENLVCRLLL